ncbi:surface lipoprotein assembly modifier [Aliidiomarina sanyensis]|uniref:DUF560 domain-containing protein n=1 Tax=Aliidiomarina sanyensis TaxID=1249555 RepID=A0A432WS69_9GAMM|nr:surface lipoprotein assembly modifier [Aliidiomarina sanyensis]RUO36616.1 hypothetical protein CWE11_02045 [Aliidiomarina sanyensis]
MYSASKHGGCALTLIAALVLSSLASDSVAATETNVDFQFRADASREYNSNVSVTELETAIGEPDHAWVYELGVDMQWQATDQVNFDAGYSFSDRRYDQFSEFDLAMHLLYGDLSYALDTWTVGFAYYLADADLGGDSFLTLHQRALYASRMFGEQWYIRAALNQTDKSFATLAERDADTLGAGVDAFYFFGEGRQFILLGASRDDEDARNGIFSYQGTTVRARYSHRFSLWQRDARWQLSYRWHDRDYKATHPSVGAPRSDRHHVIESRVEIPVWRALRVLGSVERGQYDSNLETADYAETRASVGLRIQF